MQVGGAAPGLRRRRRDSKVVTNETMGRDKPAEGSLSKSRAIVGRDRLETERKMVFENLVLQAPEIQKNCGNSIFDGWRSEARDKGCITHLMSFERCPKQKNSLWLVADVPRRF